MPLVLRGKIGETRAAVNIARSPRRTLRDGRAPRSISNRYRDLSQTTRRSLPNHSTIGTISNFEITARRFRSKSFKLPKLQTICDLLILSLTIFLRLCLSKIP